MMRIIFALLGFAVAGCDTIEPYRRTGVWYPTGANADNIAAMTARPRDLVEGRHTGRTDARQATGAIDRVSEGRALPLLNTSGAPPGGSSAGPAAAK